MPAHFYCLSPSDRVLPGLHPIQLWYGHSRIHVDEITRRMVVVGLWMVPFAVTFEIAAHITFIAEKAPLRFRKVAACDHSGGKVNQQGRRPDPVEADIFRIGWIHVAVGVPMTGSTRCLFIIDMFLVFFETGRIAVFVGKDLGIMAFEAQCEVVGIIVAQAALPNVSEIGVPRHDGGFTRVAG